MIVDFELNKLQYCKASIDNEKLLGFLTSVAVATDVTSSYKMNYNCFLGYKLSTSNNISNLNIFFNVTKEDMTDTVKEAIIDNFLSNKMEILNYIKTNYNANFQDINNIFSINEDNTDYSIEIIKALSSPFKKPLLICGLPGYGKSSICREITEKCLKNNTNEFENSAILNKFKKSTEILITGEETLADLFGRLVLEEKNNNVITSFKNGKLLSIVKDCYYSGDSGIVIMDEALDNIALLKEMKSLLMPNLKQNYSFNSFQNRNFALIKTKTNFSQDNFEYINLEIANDCDEEFAINDEAISIKSDHIIFDKNYLSDFQEKTIKMNSFANKNKVDITNEKINNIFDFFIDKNKIGNPTILITKSKFEEINNSNIDILVKKAIQLDYQLNTQRIKFLLTGNVNQTLSDAVKDRFDIKMIGGISFEKLKNDLLNNIGIKTTFFQNIDIRAKEKILSSIIDTIKIIQLKQHDGDIVSADSEFGEPTFNESRLQSNTLNPRRISYIINNSTSLNDIINNFKSEIPNILGIENFPDETQQNSIDYITMLINEQLAPKLEEIAKTHKLPYKNDTNDEFLEKKLENIADIDEILNIKNSTKLKI
ncbi:hypothetical protein [Campylobacter canadensis]|uniref:hypothetical protein n=1 Tax=Campylobacter canadensis TaxID=449520 RepID=UPI001CC9470B|nr:hypothetical protein [Campylobacter canadensis]MBZ8002356.1 hypothetical protein [Campylobacter canadensis]